MSHDDIQEAQCVPADRLSPEQYAKLMRNVEEILLMRALVRRIVPSQREATIRDALPVDLGLAGMGWRTPPLRKDVFTTYISHEIMSSRAICLYGVAQEEKEPAVCQIRVALGERACMVYNVIDLQRLYASFEITTAGVHRKEALLVSPIWFDPGQHVRIDVGSREDKPEGDKLIPLFRVIEPRGVVIV
jgi:uncharacterized protein